MLPVDCIHVPILLSSLSSLRGIYKVLYGNVCSLCKYGDYIIAIVKINNKCTVSFSLLSRLNFIDFQSLLFVLNLLAILSV